MQQSTVAAWWPVTHDIGLIRADLHSVAHMRATQYRDAGTPVPQTQVTGPLDTCLAALAPLSIPPTREMFCAATHGWTVFLQNGARGSDPFLPMWQLSRALGVTALRACVTPPGAASAAVILEVYDTPQAGGDANGHRRAIAAARDGGRWVFHATGAPLPGEDPAWFRARRISDRFTSAHLGAVLAALGAPPVTDATLAPQGQTRAVMLSRPAHADAPLYTLDEATSLLTR